mgnify:CR=1 FL=1
MRRIDQDSHSRWLRARLANPVKRLLLTLIAATAAFVIACSGGGSEEPAFESQPLSPGLQAMLEDVAEIRGLPAPTGIRIGAIPRERVAEFVESELTDDDRAAMDHLTSLYRLLGYLSANQDYRQLYLQLLTEAAIGFYAPPDSTMWLVRDELQLDPANLSEIERSTLAHEFIHAVQDNAYDLERLEHNASNIDDSGLARAAILEGDAVAHERLWLESELASNGMRSFINASAVQSSVPAALERELRFPYEAGLDWVTAIRASSGQPAINAILRDRRELTTAEIMHPAIRDTGWLPQEVALPDISSGLGGDWSRSVDGVLGEFRLANYLQLWLPSLEALGAAQGWTGDQFGLYSDGDGSLAIFRVKFFDPKDAGEFAQAHIRLLQQSGAEVEEATTGTAGTYPAGRTVIQLRDTAQDEVIFVVASTPEAAASAAALLINI